MTHRERFLATINRRTPDRIPVGKVDFCGTLLKTFREKTGRDDPDEYFDVPTRTVGGWASGAGGAMVGGTHMWKGDIDYSAYLPPIPPEGRLMCKGDGYLTGDDDMEVYLFPLKPLKTIDQLLAYPWWEAERRAAAARSWQDLKQHVDQLKSQDRFVLGWVGNPFESAWKMRGFEHVLMDFIDDPEFAGTLLDLTTEACCANAEYVARAGVDILFMYDDLALQSGPMFNVATGRQWLVPRYQKIIEAARRIVPDIPVFFHTCGNAMKMIPLLIESGVTVLNPVQPECMDPAEAKRLYGDRLAFWGTVGVQHTMPFGTPADVKAEVRLRIETVGRGGGFVLAPAQTVYSDVPWENVLAFFEAAQEYGDYHLRGDGN
jgi:uroporphyrinogen decarboxylase